ncbi:MAG: FadR family transcriptional regulator [Caulobacter sp.]|nr:FadR family transcriptional regulator [Caulobacter sp.]
MAADDHVQSGASLPIAPVRKVAEALALDIVRDIVTRGLSKGDALPLEVEMLRQYGVGRSSLREALRLLEVQGLIVIRRGRRQGAAVGSVSPAKVGRSLTLHLHMLGTAYDELLDAWRRTEPMLARLAALNPNRQQVKTALEPFLDESHARHLVEGPEFHSVVSELADNKVLWLVLRSVSSIVSEQVLPRTEGALMEKGMAHDHREIAGAIILGDADAAERLMCEHVVHVIDDFQKFWPQKVGQALGFL